MAYELGAIWLQVIPSFDGVHDGAREAGKKAAEEYHKGYDERERQLSGDRQRKAREAGEAEGRARAEGREGALTAAQERELAASRRHEEMLERERNKHRQSQKAKDADYFRDRQAREDAHRRELAKIEAQGLKEIAVAETKGHQERRKAEQAHNARMAELRQQHWQDSITRQQEHDNDRLTRQQRLNDKLVELDKRGQNALALERERQRNRLARDETAAARRQQANMQRLQDTLMRRALGDPDGFSRAMKRVLDRVEKESGLKDRKVEMELDVDSTEADAEIAKFQARLNALRDGKIDVKADTAGAIAELMALMQIAQSLDREDVDIKVDVDMGAALAQLMALDAATTSAARRQGDLADGLRDTGGQAGSAANAFRAMNGVLLAAVTIGPVLIPTLAGIAGALASIATFALAAAGGIAVGVIGLAGIGDAVSAMEDLESEQRFGGERAGRQQRRQTRSADRQVRNARRGVTDARSAAEDMLTRALERQESAQRSLAEAERNLSRAREDAVDRVADAIERQQRAERQLVDAQRNAQRAQENLTRARQQARREIEDLNNALISGAMSEQDALYDLEEARYALFRIMQDGSATQRERDRAQLSYDMQLQQYRELQLQNQRLAEDQAETSEQGVDGSRAVVDAQRAVVDADQAIIDAQKGIVDAARDRERAEVDAIRMVEDAEYRLLKAREEVADATEGIDQARIDGAERILRAEERLADALENQRDLALDAAEGVGALATAHRNLREAMAALSPEARRFAEFVQGTLRPFWENIQWSATRDFLPGLQTGIETVMGTYGDTAQGREARAGAPSLHDWVHEMGALLGDLMEGFGEYLVQPHVIEFFETLGEFMLVYLRQFGDIMPHFLDGIMGVMTALMPFTEQFGNALLYLAEGFGAWAQSEEGQETLERFFSYLVDVSPEVWEMWATLLLALLNAMVALAPHAQWVVEDVLTPFFGWVAEMDTEVLGRLLQGVILLITAFQVFAALMSGLLTTLGFWQNIKWIGSGLTRFLGLFGIGSGAKVATNASFSAGATGGAKGAAGKGALRTAATAIGRFGIIGMAIAAVLLGLWWLYENVEPFRDFVNQIRDLLVGVWNDYIYPVFQSIWGWIVDNLGPIFGWLAEVAKQGWEMILFAIDLAWTAIEVIFKLFQVQMEILGAVAGWLWSEVIKPVWNWIWEHISGVWEDHIKPVFQALGNFIEEHVAPKFRAGVELLGSIWDALKKLLAIPLVFVVDTIINDGILGALNAVFDHFDIDPVGDVRVPSSIRNAAEAPWPWDMHTGGILPGYTPGRDVHSFVSPTGQRLNLSGGEAIMRPEVTQVLGPQTVHALNAAARTGGTAGVAQLLGGVPDGASWVPDWLSSAGSAVWDATKAAGSWVADAASFAWDFITDPVGHLKGIVENIVAAASQWSEDSAVGRLVVGIPMNFVDRAANWISSTLGFDDGAKGVSGRIPKGTGGAIYGARPWVNAAAQRIARGVGQPGMFMQAFNQSMAGDHPQGLAVDFIDQIPILNRVAGYAVQNAEELGLRYLAWQGRLWSPGVGWRPQTVGYGNDPMHRWHVHISFARPGGAAEKDVHPLSQVRSRGPQLRDGGGVIEPGLNYILNATGEKEWALTRQQLDSLRGGVGGGQTIIDVDIDRPGATAGEIAEEFNFALRRARRGGAYAGV